MLPIRWRLALGYSVFLALALLALGLAAYVLLSHSLLGELDQALVLRAAEIQRSLRITGDSLNPQIATEGLEQAQDNLSLPDPYVQVLDTQGAVVLSSSNLRGQQLPVDPLVVMDALDTKPSTTVLLTASGQGIRVFSTPIIHGERVIGVVQVGESLYSTDSSLRGLSYILALGILGTWILFSVGGWLLAGRALNPLSEISQAAEHIGATGDFGQRIAYNGPKDELGVLASTFNQMIARIQKTFDAQRQFVGDASHELGSPLTVIRGNLDLLKRNLPEQDRLECQGAMEREASRMDRIIGDLLMLAQMDGQPQGRLQPVNMERVVRAVYRQAQPLAGKRRLCVEQLEAAAVMGDAHQLNQAVFNLVENAVKYTPEDGAVTLSLQANGPWLLARVADTGIGIPQEEIPHIFDRFYRVDKARSRAKGGTGLGLAIVKAISEAHGGRVTVESAPGKGSVFTLWLPVSNPSLISS
ncbi:MAG: HAMP domain-containing sensor histidine kinase [Dehalococcoidia bacterium]|nr:HAMP domain-containing sensor histidine kinase [Dehalococcoidia bacterium]